MTAVTEIHQKFEAHKEQVETALGEPVSISGLTGPLRIFQRVKGHRHSIDDAMTAWYALQKCSAAMSLLDLGTGVGTVGMIVLWGLHQQAKLTCIEAQQISYTLLQSNITCNGLAERAQPIYGDLRELSLDQKFDLITGSPPYFPADAGVLPQDSQKAHARFELRGDVGDYARAAKKHLKPDGLFVFCFPYQQKLRCIRLVEEAGFTIVTVRDVVPYPTKDPLFSLYSARLNWNEPMLEEPPFIVADNRGVYTPEMRALQLTRGFGPEGTNTIG